MRAIVNKYCGVFAGMGVMALVSSALIAMVMPQSAEAQVCAAVRAAHGGVVTLRKCVKTADIANNAIASRNLKPSIVIGKSNKDGSLRVRRIGGPGQLMFEVDPVNNDVRIGRGGDPATERSDTDLYVYDPWFTQSPTEPALFFNASLAELYLGSGDNQNSGDAGDIFLRDGDGETGVSILGGDGSMILGNLSNPGDLIVLNGASQTTFNVQGSNGDVTNILSGNGLVKAWCRLRASDGVVLAGFRCNTDVLETRRLDTGEYEVDFTPLASDITTRTFVAACSSNTTSVDCSQALAESRSGDVSSLFVETRTESGVLVDSDFTVLVF